jgi:hypothetical protein
MTGSSDDLSGFDFDLFTIIREAAIEIVAREDYPAFVRWLTRRLERELPAGAFNDEHGVGAMANALGRVIWNATPLPSNDWRPRLVPEPGRNDDCPCGSGLKYKRCCSRLPRFPTIVSEEMWAVLLEELPIARVNELLAKRHVPTALLGSVARRLLEDDRPRDAVRLLEPLLAPPFERIDERLSDAVDALSDAYLALGQTKKKVVLLEGLAMHAPRALRAEAHQRLATVYSDMGELPRAWESFHHAQREKPDHPALAVLEVTALGRTARRRGARPRGVLGAPVVAAR